MPQLAFLIVLSAMFLPNWLLLVWGVPFVQLDYTALLSFGDAHIRAYDLLILVIGLKTFSFIFVSRHLVHSPLYKPMGIFLAVLLGATLLSYYRFGLDIFGYQLISFLRFILLFVVFFLTAHSILTPRHLTLTTKFLNLFGYIAAASIYLGLALFMIGVEFGEISRIGEAAAESVRTFGMFGDQIGFLLPFFFYKEILSHKIPRATFFGLAILQTGTRGALIALGTGLVLIHLLSGQYKDFWKKNQRRIMSGIIVIAIAIIAFIFNLGGIRTQFDDREVFDLGLIIRGTTFAIASEVFIKNLITGVGFSGFRLVASDYGAEATFDQNLSYSPNLVSIADQNLSYSPNFVSTAANQFLQVATDAGILGLITFIWMMRRCLRVLKTAQGVAPIGVRQSLAAAHIWLWSLLVGAQSAAWLLPDMTLSYILCVVLGMATAAISMEHSATHRQMSLRSAEMGERKSLASYR